METVKPHKLEILDDNWFKHESLTALKDQVRTPYPGYPLFEQRLHSRWLGSDLWNNVHIPNGPWWVNSDDFSGGPEPGQVRGAYEYDTQNRPLHPWFWDMVQNPDIGVVCGKGFYWNWGPNFTADPIVIRRDLEQPHILLVQRDDTKQWALPGGFVDGIESAQAAAVRETFEEANINLYNFAPTISVVYEGPVADPRTTAHAWAETSAILFDLPPHLSTTLPQGMWAGGDDAQIAGWIPLDRLNDRLFGSHKLLIELALEQLPYEETAYPQ